MRLESRRVEIAGMTPYPNSAWMKQVGRNLTDCSDGFLRDSSHLIIDRDTKHLPLCEILDSTNIEIVTLPPISPNLDAHLERFMRSLKSECLIRMILSVPQKSRYKSAQKVRSHQFVHSDFKEFTARFNILTLRLTKRRYTEGYPESLIPVDRCVSVPSVVSNFP